MAAMLAHTWAFILAFVILGTIGYIIGFPLLGGIIAVVIACVYVYIKGVMAG